METDRNYFASNLKFLRQKNKMEQIDLASRLGRKSSSSISEWERGKYTPKAGVLNDIAKIFGVSLSDLMGSDLSNPIKNKEYTINNQVFNVEEMANNVMMFGGRELTDEKKKIIQSIIEGYLKEAGD